ncbi:unnamed protein product [Somion occarium]|uniref:Uncharacterized protein n=1 Tax=Somion occarium TaxID=3059160 RepID=A0ABP1DP82_9APHY
MLVLAELQDKSLNLLGKRDCCPYIVLQDLRKNLWRILTSFNQPVRSHAAFTFGLGDETASSRISCHFFGECDTVLACRDDWTPLSTGLVPDTSKSFGGVFDI